MRLGATRGALSRLPEGLGIHRGQSDDRFASDHRRDDPQSRCAHAPRAGGVPAELGRRLHARPDRRRHGPHAGRGLHASSTKPAAKSPSRSRPTCSSSRTSRSSPWISRRSSRVSAIGSIGVARTRNEAVEAVRRQQPGLVLADIQLADGSSGLDAVNDILASLRGAGDLHHRLSGALPHRRAAGAGVPDHQAVPARDRKGRRSARRCSSTRSRTASRSRRWAERPTPSS